MTEQVPRQRSADTLLRCAVCGGQHQCEGQPGSMRLAEESVLFQGDHAGCVDSFGAALR